MELYGNVWKINGKSNENLWECMEMYGKSVKIYKKMYGNL